MQLDEKIETQGPLPADIYSAISTTFVSGAEPLVSESKTEVRFLVRCTKWIRLSFPFRLSLRAAMRIVMFRFALTRISPAVSAETEGDQKRCASDSASGTRKEITGTRKNT